MLDGCGACLGGPCNSTDHSILVFILGSPGFRKLQYHVPCRASELELALELLTIKHIGLRFRVLNLSLSDSQSSEM